ncbi:MAG: hypothetical protein SOX32_08080 [Candidatus Choladocola sp.]|nr:hypothetical protein [Candidatus Choladocola sp.]
MRRNRKKVRMAAVAVLASALAFSSSALAAPADELNAIFERQKELQQESFLEQRLGFSDLGKAICENGLYFSTRAEIGRDTAEFFELTEEIPEGGMQVRSSGLIRKERNGSWEPAPEHCPAQTMYPFWIFHFMVTNSSLRFHFRSFMTGRWLCAPVILKNSI